MKNMQQSKPFARFFLCAALLGSFAFLTQNVNAQNSDPKAKTDKNAGTDAKTENDAQELLKKGVESLKLKQEELGITTIKQVIQQYPGTNAAAKAELVFGNYYFKKEQYDSAMQIFRQFAENHKDHALASSGMMLAGYSAVKFEEQKIKDAEKAKKNYTPDYTQACTIFQELIDMFPNDKDKCPEAMYLLGDLMSKAPGTEMKAKGSQFFQNLVRDYPETRWAKLARGRLAERPKN